MEKQYRIDKQRAVQRFRRSTAETNPDIQTVLPLAELMLSGLIRK